MEANLIPTPLLRVWIQHLLKTKCLIRFSDTENEMESEMKFLKDLRVGREGWRLHVNRHAAVWCLFLCCRYC